MIPPPDPLPPTLRIAPREAPVAEITRKLLEFLLSGEVTPGSKIPSERQLAEALGVGRSAVREAIKSLNLLGLLDVRQGDGTYLNRSGSDLLPRVIEWGLLLQEPRILDLVEARGEIEVIVAGLAAQRRTDDDVAAIKAQLDAMAAAEGDVPTYVDADIAFHVALAKASGNETFEGLLNSLRSLLLVWAARVLEHAGETKSSLAMHEPIFEAVANRDSEAARETMRAHMERANRRLRDAIASSQSAVEQGEADAPS